MTILFVATILLSSCGGGADNSVRTDYANLQRQASEALTAKKYAEAEPLIKRTHQIWIGAYGENDELMSGVSDLGPSSKYTGRLPVPSYADLAMSYEGQGKWALAEPLRRKIVAAHERAQPFRGPLGTDVCTHTKHLAANLAAQGKFDEAVTQYRKAAAIAVASVKAEDFPKRPDQYERMKVAVGAEELAAIAEIYRQQKRYKDAEPLFKQALEADRGNMAGGDEVQWMANYAKLLRETGRTAEADALDEKVRINREFPRH